jgi:hypothetical protein
MTVRPERAAVNAPQRRDELGLRRARPDGTVVLLAC